MKDLKTNLGYLVVVATIVYCIAITIALFWGCSFSEIVKDMILIILTWFISKSGTIIDYFYGSSKSSQDKDATIAKLPPVPDNHPCWCSTPDAETHQKPKGD